jgi:hypothetical protein
MTDCRFQGRAIVSVRACRNRPGARRSAQGGGTIPASILGTSRVADTSITSSITWPTLELVRQTAVVLTAGWLAWWSSASISGRPALHL